MLLYAAYLGNLFLGFAKHKVLTMSFFLSIGYADVCILLIQNGADPNFKDNSSGTPLNIAVQEGNSKSFQ